MKLIAKAYTLINYKIDSFSNSNNKEINNDINKEIKNNDFNNESNNNESNNNESSNKDLKLNYSDLTIKFDLINIDSKETSNINQIISYEYIITKYSNANQH